MLALGMTTEAVAQKHRHTPQTVQLTELVDSTGKDAVEAFSDTTSTSQTSAADDNSQRQEQRQPTAQSDILRPRGETLWMGRGAIHNARTDVWRRDVHYRPFARGVAAKNYHPPK